MVLTGYVVRAPVRPAFVSPSSADSSSANLAPATRAPGPHAFVVRNSHASSKRDRRVYRIPPHDRDDAFAPLHRGGTAGSLHLFSEKRKQYIFAQTTGQIRFSSDLRKVICPTGSPICRVRVPDAARHEMTRRRSGTHALHAMSK